MSRIFISYSYEDRFFAELLVRELEALGEDVFYDRRIKPGSPWDASIDEAIDKADFVLAAMSNGYLLSNRCKHQLRHALLRESDGGGLVIPMMLESCRLPELVERKASANFMGQFDPGLDALLAQLLGAIAGVGEQILFGYPRYSIGHDRLQFLTNRSRKSTKEKLGSPRIFLCHAIEDKPRVEKIYYALGSRGLSPWYDEKDLLLGDQWHSEIVRAIEDSDFFAVFLSHRASRKRGYINEEIRTAIEEYRRRPAGVPFFLPIKLDDCEVPRIKLDATTSLTDYQWIQLSDTDPHAGLLLANLILKQWEKTGGQL